MIYEILWYTIIYCHLYYHPYYLKWYALGQLNFMEVQGTNELQGIITVELKALITWKEILRCWEFDCLWDSQSEPSTPINKKHLEEFHMSRVLIIGTQVLVLILATFLDATEAVRIAIYIWNNSHKQVAYRLVFPSFFNPPSESWIFPY